MKKTLSNVSASLHIPNHLEGHHPHNGTGFQLSRYDSRCHFPSFETSTNPRRIPYARCSAEILEYAIVSSPRRGGANVSMGSAALNTNDWFAPFAVCTGVHRRLLRFLPLTILTINQNV